MRISTLRMGAAILLAWLASSGAHLAASAPVTDCPLARAPYSVDTPLFDLLLDERAREALDRSGLTAKLPPGLGRTTTPSFATIVSPRWIAGYTKLPSDTLGPLDRELAGLPIRPHDIVARCGRYEPSAKTPLSVPNGRRSVLVFEKSNGFRDGPSVEAATAALRRIAERRGWHIVFTNSSGDFTPATLRRFDAVVWNNVSGDALTEHQRRAFRDYVEGGGGFAGFHGSGGDPVYWWDWYADALIGARFIGHPDAHQEGRLSVEGASAITHGIDPGWSLTEEWYSFASSPRTSGARVLVTLDEQSYRPQAGARDLSMGDHPVAWTRCARDGRSFYSAIGHRPEVYSDPRNQVLMEQGIAWAMGLSDTKCRGGREIMAHHR